MEEELAGRAAELAEADRRKDEFLAMLAHELRNPLAADRNAARPDRRRDARPGRTSPGPCEVIGRQVRHLTRLIDDLLDVSRITRGKIRAPAREPVDLAADRRAAPSRPSGR